MSTSAYLLSLYGPHLDTDELARLFKYSDRHSVLEQVRKGKFPVPTFKLGKKRVADVRDVATYVDKQKAAAASL